jgi:diacylglycerol kinase
MKRAFIYALRGIVDAARHERSFRIMLICFAAVLLGGIACSLTVIEWAIVLICGGVTLALEVLNTALEAAIDLATGERCELARKAKDAAAGASLIFSFISAAVGLAIFIPYIIRTFKAQ